MRELPTLIFLDENHHTSPVMEIISQLMPALEQMGYNTFMDEIPASTSITATAEDTAAVVEMMEHCKEVLGTIEQDVKAELKSRKFPDRKEMLTSMFSIILDAMAKAMHAAQFYESESVKFTLKHFDAITTTYAGIELLHDAINVSANLLLNVDDELKVVLAHYDAVLRQFIQTYRARLEILARCIEHAIDYVPIDHQESITAICEENPATQLSVLYQKRSIRDAFMVDAYCRALSAKPKPNVIGYNGLAHVEGLQREFMARLEPREISHAVQFIFIQSYTKDRYLLQACTRIAECRNKLSALPLPVTVIDASDKPLAFVMQLVLKHIKSIVSQPILSKLNMRLLSKPISLTTGSSARQDELQEEHITSKKQ